MGLNTKTNKQTTKQSIRILHLLVLNKKALQVRKWQRKVPSRKTLLYKTELKIKPTSYSSRPEIMPNEKRFSKEI